MCLKNLCDCRAAARVLAALPPPNFFREYVLHFGKWLDSFAAVEAVESIRASLSFS